MVELRKSPSGPEVDVPGLPINSDDVTNVSEVDGDTVTDSLNELLDPSVVTLPEGTDTLQASYAGKYIRVTSAAPFSLHVPEMSNIPFAIGTLIIVVQAGAGALTLVADGVVVLNKPPSRTLVFNEQYSQVALKKVAVNTWDVDGGLGT